VSTKSGQPQEFGIEEADWWSDRLMSAAATVSATAMTPAGVASPTGMVGAARVGMASAATVVAVRAAMVAAVRMPVACGACGGRATIETNAGISVSGVTGAGGFEQTLP